MHLCLGNCRTWGKKKREYTYRNVRFYRICQYGQPNQFFRSCWKGTAHLRWLQAAVPLKYRPPLWAPVPLINYNNTNY